MNKKFLRFGGGVLVVLIYLYRILFQAQSIQGEGFFLTGRGDGSILLGLAISVVSLITLLIINALGKNTKWSEIFLWIGLLLLSLGMLRIGL